MIRVLAFINKMTIKNKRSWDWLEAAQWRQVNECQPETSQFSVWASVHAY